MKGYIEILILSLAIIVFSITSYTQNKKGVGKSFYTTEEVKKMCGIQIDPVEMRRALAKQDSMYKQYISNLKDAINGLHKTQSIPNWQSMMSPVENQNDDQCTGDCWAHAASGVVEGQLHILVGNNININLDEDNIVNITGGCGSYSPAYALGRIQTYKTISEVGTYPNLTGVRWSIASYNSNITGINGIKNALANGPVTASFMVYEDFAPFFDDYPQGIYHYDGDSPESNGHGVVIVSYNDNEQYWLCKNSWGSNWADNGYFRIGYGECGIESLQNTVITVNQSCLAKISPNLLTLTDALNYNFVNNEYAYIYSGTNTITGTLNPIPSTCTLIINNNSTTNLNGYSIVANGGTITKEASATIQNLRATLTRNSALRGLCGTIQAAVNAITDSDYGNSYTLDMPNGSFSENVSISNKYNLYFIGSGSTTVNGTISVSSSQYCTFINFAVRAISLNCCYVPTFSNINLNIGSVNPSLYAYNCTNLYFTGGYISDRYAYTNQTGFHLYQSSTSTIDGSTNTVIYTNAKGVYANASTVNIDYVNFCNNTYDLATSGGATIYADYCYFPGGTASTQGSGIYLYGNQTADCSGLPKRSGSLTNSSTKESEILSDEFKQIDRNNFDIAIRVRADISENKGFDKEKYRNDYLSVVDDYKKFINKYPESDYSKTALISSVHIYRTLDDYEGMRTYLQNIISDNNLAKENGWAKRFMIDYYSHNKDFTTALNMAEEILKEYEDNDDLVCNVLFVEGLIYLYDLNNNDAAIACFSDIVDKYPNNDVATFAINELKLLGIEKEKKEIKASEQEVVGFSSSSFPNPFNPSTTIEYNLPVDTKVMIKVYDMVGREVKTLVNAEKAAGRYSVIFNASSLSSGVYFYSIKAGDFYQVKKLLLVK